ncbi:MAG: cellulase family glycosylhydrolase [Pseudomonadota bacterium]
MPLSESSTADLDVVLRSNWGSGIVVDLTLTAEQSLNGWTIEFEYDGDIVNIWNARIVSQVGNRYVIESLGYNSALAAGASAGFGFQGRGSATEITPISINGDLFDGGGGADPAPEPLPTVSVGDAAASEEDGTITFTVTLSEAAAEDVVVSYQTVAGSAVAGSDFVAAQSQVVIAAGQTSATVTVQLANDDTPEATEQFELRLVSADGADIVDGSGTGQITDSDTDPTPPPAAVVSMADASATEGDPGAGGSGGGTPSPGGSLIADGPLSTLGNQIVDANGNPVQIRAINWFGAENDVRAPHGLWTRPMTDMMDQMVEEGFNAIRLPFSVQNILEDQVATSVAGDPSLAGLTTLEIFDEIVAYAEQIGIKIILDAHRITQGNGAEGIWYTGGFDESDWVGAWEILAERYGDSPAVIGADLFNEPHLGTWGTGQRNDWAAAAEQAGNAVLDIAPDWLILVEGIGSYQGNNYWWGGQLQGVRDRPVELTVDNKLVYSPHDYPASVYPQPWFTDGSNLYDVFRDAWGFIYEEEIAPILLGEFGSRLQTPLDQAWADAITAYLAGDFDGDGVNDLDPGEVGMSFAWWSWNPNSSDTGGYLENDWRTVRQNAAELLDPLLEGDAAGDPGGGGSVFLTFDVLLDAPSTGVSYAYETRDGTATAGEDYVASAGTVSFAPGQQAAQIQIEVIPDSESEGDETFSLVLFDLDGSEVVATGTIVDDDAAGGDPDPVDPDPDPDPDPVDPDPDPDPDPVDPDPDPGHQHPGAFTDITAWGSFHGSSSHTGHGDLAGGRTAITTEALVAYNGLRNFLGLEDTALQTIGQWAFDNGMTNNSQAWGDDLFGVGLFYAMQGAKVGWIRDDAFDPQILADIQREARLGDASLVMQMVADYGHDGFADYLTQNDLVDHFVNTLKMEPHYGGWMHGRVHGGLVFPDGEGARSHDVNHLTVLSHDQTQPFMNDTFDWPQWAALNVPHQDVIDYFQSMVVLGDPLGDALPSDGQPNPPVDPDPDPVDPPPVDPDPVDPDPVDPIPDDGSESLDARLKVVNDWGSGAVVHLEISNVDQFRFTDGWTVEFGLDPTLISGSWNSDWNPTDGSDGLTVSDVGWNGSIGAGETIAVGFKLNIGNLDEDALNADAGFLFL